MSRVDVFLMGITNLQTGSDPGDELEIFGNIYVYKIEDRDGQRIESDQITLWSKGLDEAIAIPEKYTHEDYDAKRRMEVGLRTHRLGFFIALEEEDDGLFGSFGDNDPMVGSFEVNFGQRQPPYHFVEEKVLFEDSQIVKVSFLVVVHIPILASRFPPIKPSWRSYLPNYSFV